MQKINHTIYDLFGQLGLANDAVSISNFLSAQKPLGPSLRLEEAAFWNASQRHLLQEQLAIDADWSYAVDQLNLALH